MHLQCSAKPAQLLITLSFVFVGVIPAAAQVQYLGWWDTGGDGQNPIPFLEQTSEQHGKVNFTMSVTWWDESDWQLARDYGVKVVATWPLNYYLQIDRYQTNAAPMAAWLSMVAAHRDQLAAVFVADEQDCNYKTARFPRGWTESNCKKARYQAEANLSVLRAHLPGIPMWINYTSAFANYFTMNNAANRRLPSADWISFDCYTAWDRCFGTKSVSKLVSGLMKWMKPFQRIVLIPPARTGVSQDPNVIAAWGWRYWTYAATNPRVVTIAPFIYWTMPNRWWGGRDQWAVRGLWESIGAWFVSAR